MKDLYLLNFNNYYNRQIKRKNFLSEYERFQVGDMISNVNFVPGDGITTEHIINSNYLINETPDYLVVTDVGSDNIVSRWFVIESKRLRTGQYKLNLKRDSIADNFNKVLSADCLIKNATLNDDDPLIFNGEGLRFNQIKQSETALKDYTSVPWIVGYISPDVAKDAGEISGAIEGYFDTEYTSLDEYPYYQYRNIVYNNVEKLAAVATTRTDNTYKTVKHCLYTNKSRRGDDIGNIKINTQVYGPENNKVQKYWDELLNVDIGAVRDIFSNVETQVFINDLKKENGRVIKVADKLYTVKVEIGTHNNGSPAIGQKVDRIIQSCFRDCRSKLINPVYPEQKFEAGEIELWSEYAILSLVEKPFNESTFTFNFKNVDVSNEETPYGIICMPYSDIYSVNSITNEEEKLKLEANSRLKIMQALGSISNLLYDIQLLPYCPITNLKIEDNDIITKNQTYKSVSIYTAEKAYITSLLVAKQASFNFIINNPITIDDVKMSNETDLWRLCSPNYAGVFEFNAAKFYTGSKTTINYFTVDCTYKPYTPYIHVAPQFKGLYGKNFGDARGLICGGDFSIDRINDAWATYQYNNKNFQLQFDRQMETMELNKKWDMASGAVNGIGNAVTGGLMGGLAGGPAGAIAGVGAGLIDLGFNTAEAFYKTNDAIDAAKDQHNYFIDNIQAQPYGLTKVSALNKNNKIFPFVEYYTCTDKEKENLKKYLKYNGMTVGKVSNIKEFLRPGETFIRASVIRLENLSEDAHILYDINNELSMGVFIND